MNMRIGLGTDLHTLAAGLPLLLGGVPILSELGCQAHSDGDVLIHALIDALFGAAALGDIGGYFPPSDDQYKDISSMILLEKSLAILQEKGFRIINIDAVISLEKPKLYPFKQSIRQNLARCLHLDLDCISIKAKTNEKVDAVGEGRAIAAQVIVLLSK